MPQEAESWTDNEVLERWTHLYTGPRTVQQWHANTLDNPADYETLNRLIEIYCQQRSKTEPLHQLKSEPLSITFLD
jgi:hypothetical protein